MIAIVPSITNTEVYNQIEDNVCKQPIESTTLKRTAEPIEVANAAVFLAGDLLSFIIGQVLRVDGELMTKRSF